MFLNVSHLLIFGDAAIGLRCQKVKSGQVRSGRGVKTWLIWNLNSMNCHFDTRYFCMKYVNEAADWIENQLNMKIVEKLSAVCEIIRNDNYKGVVSPKKEGI